MASTEVAKTEMDRRVDRTRLALMKDGTLPTAILPNIRLIVANDPRTRGMIALQPVHERPQVLVKEPGVRELDADRARRTSGSWTADIWQVPDKLRGTEMNDSHVTEIRNMIEAPSVRAATASR